MNQALPNARIFKRAGLAPAGAARTIGLGGGECRGEASPHPVWRKGAQASYWWDRSADGLEVDLIVDRGKGSLTIEVKYQETPI